MRSAGFRCDLAFRCGDGIQCPGQHVNDIVLDGCYPQLSLLDAASFIYFYKLIAGSVTRVQYLPGADLGQTCPDMTIRAHACTHTCTVCHWAKVFCLH